MKFKTFTAEALLAADVNNLLMRQAVIQVDNTTQQALIPAPTEGMVCYLTSAHRFEFFNGVDWKPWQSDWITYNSVLTNFSVGTGGSALNSTRYKWIGGRALLKAKFVLGTTSYSMGTTPKFTLPFAVAALGHDYQVYESDGDMFDFSANAVRLAKIVTDGASVTTARIAYLNNIAGLFDYPTAATPWASWGPGDAIALSAWLDPA